MIYQERKIVYRGNTYHCDPQPYKSIFGNPRYKVLIYKNGNLYRKVATARNRYVANKIGNEYLNWIAANAALDNKKR